MATQVQCPNCGGFRVSTTGTYMDPTTGKIVGGRALGCTITVITTLLLFVIAPLALWAATILLLILGILSNAQLYQETGFWTVAILLSATIVPLGVGILLFTRFESRRQRAVAKALRVYDSKCDLCGYSWRWNAGFPRLAAQVRPDLIQQGAKKLEEEQAAAAWYLQQQNAKKK